MDKVLMAHILVVDDDPAARSLLKLLLGQHGFTVNDADDGQMALDWLDTHPNDCPDLVIVDLLMPQMDGIKFLGELHQRCMPPVLVLTANLNLMRDTPSYPRIAYLEKPFRIGPLLSQIYQLLHPPTPT